MPKYKEGDVVWPKNKDGTEKTLGEMSKENRDRIFKEICKEKGIPESEVNEIIAEMDKRIRH